MESLIEKAKKNIVKLGNKISDSYYRDKWDQSQVNTALFTDTPEEDIGTFSKFDQQVKEPEEVSKVSVEDTNLSKVSITDFNLEDLPSHVEKVVPDGLTESSESYCYYVIVKHKSDSTRAIIRSCDNEHVAITSDDGLINRLEYEFCPKCGKHVEYLETEIE